MGYVDIAYLIMLNLHALAYRLTLLIRNLICANLHLPQRQNLSLFLAARKVCNAVSRLSSLGCTQEC